MSISTPCSREDLIVPQYAFVPDAWTTTFQEGLLADKSEIVGKRLLEVGVGTGAMAIFGLTKLEVAHYYGSDLDPNLPTLASQNIERICPDEASRFMPILGSTNLLTPVDKNNRSIILETDIVIACIPQAIRPPDKEVCFDDLAHYYPGNLFENYQFNSLALGLNEALLEQFMSVVRETKDYNKRIYLNIAGRVGLENIKELFKSHGLTSEIVHQVVIPQCPSTSLQFFVDIETASTDNAFKCEFYSDPEGNCQISANEAEKRRLQKDPVFHKLYVIKGIPQLNSVNLNQFLITFLDCIRQQLAQLYKNRESSPLLPYYN
ncbi:hypothetical protein A2335_01695 [Candidatus Peregrinibacteria bacterium RIFOXYB2_FULL_32_7]|nr:MAG: hypothetical protein A2335_01695 [Candidatus Peregrinibacteria bacterium RIFOXYB2_FULL_32_7]